MNAATAALAEARLDRFLTSEPVVWLSTVRPDGAPHLVPIWFTWDGTSLLVFSKPGAQKVRNLRANPVAMLALGEPEDDFDVALAEARVELARRAGDRTSRRTSRQVRGPAGGARVVARGVPRHVLAGAPDHADPLAAMARPDDAAKRARRGHDRGARSRGGPPHARRADRDGPTSPTAGRRRCRSRGAAAAVVVAPAAMRSCRHRAPVPAPGSAAGLGRRVGRQLRALPEVREDLARGVLAGLPGDAAAGMGARPARYSPSSPKPVAGVAEQRPPQEELVEAGLAVQRVAAGQAVVALEVERGEDLAGRDQRRPGPGAYASSVATTAVAERLAPLVPRRPRGGCTACTGR